MYILEGVHVTMGVDFLYHVQTNVSVKASIIWGASTHSIHIGESVYIQKDYQGFWRSTKGALMFGEKIWQYLDVLVPFIVVIW